MMTLTNGTTIAQLATSIEHVVTPTATIAGTTGFILIGTRFWMTDSFEVWPQGAGPGAPEPETVRVDLEGIGYVPMFRAVSDAVLTGLTESPIHPLSATIEVLEVIDDVRRQLLDSSYPCSGHVGKTAT